MLKYILGINSGRYVNTAFIKNHKLLDTETSLMRTTSRNYMSNKLNYDYVSPISNYKYKLQPPPDYKLDYDKYKIKKDDMNKKHQHDARQFVQYGQNAYGNNVNYFGRNVNYDKNYGQSVDSNRSSSSGYRSSSTHPSQNSSNEYQSLSNKSSNEEKFSSSSSIDSKLPNVSENDNETPDYKTPSDDKIQSDESQLQSSRFKIQNDDYTRDDLKTANYFKRNSFEDKKPEPDAKSESVNQIEKDESKIPNDEYKLVDGYQLRNDFKNVENRTGPIFQYEERSNMFYEVPLMKTNQKLKIDYEDEPKIEPRTTNYFKQGTPKFDYVEDDSVEFIEREMEEYDDELDKREASHVMLEYEKPSLEEEYNRHMVEYQQDIMNSDPTYIYEYEPDESDKKLKSSIRDSDEEHESRLTEPSFIYEEDEPYDLDQEELLRFQEQFPEESVQMMSDILKNKKSYGYWDLRSMVDRRKHIPRVYFREPENAGILKPMFQKNADTIYLNTPGIDDEAGSADALVEHAYGTTDVSLEPIPEKFPNYKPGLLKKEFWTY